MSFSQLKCQTAKQLLINVYDHNLDQFIQQKNQFFLLHLVCLSCYRSSTEDEEDEENGSMCSCSGTQREGDAFPKAFERDLVTPTNLTIPGEKLVS